jgi:hypothetical protein
VQHPIKHHDDIVNDKMAVSTLRQVVECMLSNTIKVAHLTLECVQQNCSTGCVKPESAVQGRRPRQILRTAVPQATFSDRYGAAEVRIVPEYAQMWAPCARHDRGLLTVDGTVGYASTTPDSIRPLVIYCKRGTCKDRLMKVKCGVRSTTRLQTQTATH